MPKTLDKNLAFATEAKIFARIVIKRGSTQIEDNNLDISGFELLDDSVKKLRKLIRHRLTVSDHLRIIPEDTLERYTKLISLTASYALGNCFELSLHAFNYLVNDCRTQNMNCEIFELKKGDHIFLVLDRDAKSDVNRPLTWGENAVICDPWANQCYPAKFYLSKLSGYKRIVTDKGDSFNELESFNPRKHSFITGNGFNYSSSEIRRLQQENIPLIKEIFSLKASILLKNLFKLKDKLVHCQLLEKNDQVLELIERTDWVALKLQKKLSHSMPYLSFNNFCETLYDLQETLAHTHLFYQHLFKHSLVKALPRKENTSQNLSRKSEKTDKITTSIVRHQIRRG